MDIKQKVGARIKELRTELQLSQEAVANRAEIERTFMTHVGAFFTFYLRDLKDTKKNNQPCIFTETILKWQKENYGRGMS